MSPIDIVLVPGYWEGPAIFDHVKPALETAGYEVFDAPLPSTGQLPGPGNTLQADVASIRKVIESRVEMGKDVLVVAHSAGGFLSAHATQHLGTKARAEAGKKGGVAKFAFLAGALFPQGHEHGPAPFFDVKGDKLWCKDASHALFNDLPPDEAEAETKKLNFQPGSGWDGVIEYCGWTEIPSAYLVCESDQCIPPHLQEQIAGFCQSNPVQKCDAGHCVPKTQPNTTVDFIGKVIVSL